MVRAQSMLKKMLFLALLVIFSGHVYANCFAIKELDGNTVHIEGECQKQISPCSTFKIPLALMGFDSGILKDQRTPRWDFKTEYEKANHVCIEKWKHPHDPASWTRNSCIWYSQVLTQKLGIDKFKKYVKLFDYGNQDVSGDEGKNNGLTHSWLSSSLKISPIQQINLISKILKNELPISKSSIEATKQILFLTDLDKNWRLFGKTGSGYQLNSDGSYNEERQIGWMIGWIQNTSNNKKYVFAYLLHDTSSEKVVAGLRAKEQAEEKIKHLISNENLR